MNTQSSAILCFSPSVVHSGNNDIPKFPQKDIPVTVSSEVPSSVTLSAESTDPVDMDFHIKWARQAFEAIKIALRRYPCHKDLNKAEKEFTRIYAKRSVENTAMKWLKFHTSYLFAKAMNQVELPLAPDGNVVPSSDELQKRQQCASAHKNYQRPADLREDDGCLCNGYLSHICSDIIKKARGGSWPYRRCAYDILMSKLGMPTAPEEYVRQSYRDHQLAMTREDQDVSYEHDRYLRKIEHKIQEICSKVFRGVSLLHSDFIPSFRAEFDTAIKDGGAAGHLIKSWPDKDRLLSTVHCDELLGMWERRPGEVEQLHLVVADDRVASFQDWVDKIWSDHLKVGEEESLSYLPTKPVPIREPLKIRMITKGPSIEYYRCIELQKMMHRALRRQKPFEYIGHPIDDLSWLQCFGTLDDLKPNEFYVSGDYKAATDNLDPTLSEFAWKCICSQVKVKGEILQFTPYAELGKRALTHHFLVYPDEIPDLAPVVTQSWGQLMGSPMSFPILCIVNLAATLVALNKDYSQDLSIKVNGDDIGFIADADSYSRWKEVTAHAGLQFSVGKNYTSREFLIMNSELRRPPKFHVEANVVEDEFYELDPSGNVRRGEHINFSRKPWKLEGFINQSILNGTCKKGQDAGKKKPTFWPELESLSNELLRGFSSKTDKDVAFCQRLLGTFIHNHTDTIRAAPFSCGKWLPRSLGGMGLHNGYVSLESHEKEERGHQAYLLRKKDPKDLGLNSPINWAKYYKIAGFLACNPARRLLRPTVKRELTGEIKEILHDLILLSNKQTTPVLRNKPLRREQVQMVGGKVILQNLLFADALNAGNERKDTKGNLLGMGGDSRPPGGMAMRKIETRLRTDYTQWVKGYLESSLHPMKPENVQQFHEHLEVYSRVELLSLKAEQRSLDAW